MQNKNRMKQKHTQLHMQMDVKIDFFPVVVTAT